MTLPDYYTCLAAMVVEAERYWSEQGDDKQLEATRSLVAPLWDSRALRGLCSLAGVLVLCLTAPRYPRAS